MIKDLKHIFFHLKNDPVSRPRTSSIGNKEHHHHESHDPNSVRFLNYFNFFIMIFNITKKNLKGQMAIQPICEGVKDSIGSLI